MPKTLVQPYLLFAGRCDEALAFYGTALGATVDFKMMFNQSPDAGSIPPGFENKVMHCTFRIGDNVLMASDGNDPGEKFSGFSLSLALATEAEATSAFNALAVGGKVGMPLGKTFWSPCFGMLTDRFGLGWMISVTPPAA